jgi:hypothetical protein
MEDGREGAFACMALQESRTSETVIASSVRKIWSAPWSDLALLLVDNVAMAPDGKPLPPLAMTMLPPSLGAEVRAFGYPHSTADVADESVTISRRGTTSIGNVIEIHHDGRDSARLSWPCIRVNARFDAGMSGGPVFNTRGELCGVISSNMPPSAPDEEHISYVTLLWPLLGVTLDIPRDGRPPGRYPVLELARDETIVARHWERVSLECDDAGEITSIAFAHEP